MRPRLLAALLAGTTLALPALAADAAKVKSVTFTPTPAPASAEEMAQPLTRSVAVITYADGREQGVPLAYTILYRSGDFVPDWYGGAVVDKTGTLLASVKTAKSGTAQGPFFAFSPDANSLIRLDGATIEGVKGNPLFLATHFEYHTESPNTDPSRPPIDMYGQLPMGITLASLDQNPETGQLTAVKLANVDASAVAGIWTPCAGSLTPWNTHLGSEEYEPDAQTFETKPFEPMNAYLDTPGKTAAEGGANPYMYGHITEVTVKPDGTSAIAKHFAMGRLAFELADVMPDGKTAYIGDDGDDVIRAMFVADKPGDLSAGTLYAAKWVQTSGDDYGRATLQWIKLGHATDAEIKALIDKGLRFSDIFEVAEPKDIEADPKAYADMRPVYVYPGTGGGKAKLTYLKPKPGMEQAAAFLETRRYAAYLGATTEFTKMEGQAHNAADKTLYTVISYIRDPMIDGKNADRPRDDIRLSGDAKDLACGVVYKSAMKGGVKDTAGAPIMSDWVAVDAAALVHGAKKPEGQAVGKYDTCDTDKVANPDNIKYSEAMRTVFIGEDSNNHLNNFIWAVNPDTGVAVRIFSAPAGAENTGLQAVDAANGFAYIMANIQHPAAMDELHRYPEIAPTLRGLVDPRGAVGYLGPLPAMTR
jgi:Predicted phosphatase